MRGEIVMSAINLPWSISEGEKGWTEVIDAEGDIVFRVAEWEEGDLQEFYNNDVVKSRQNVDLILELVNEEAINEQSNDYRKTN